MPIPCSGCKKECTSELVGTFILVLVGPASIILASSASWLPGEEALVLVAIAFGGTVAAVVFFLGKHSGAAINPAITVAVASAKLLRKDLFVPYLFFQLVGGLLAGLTLRLFFLSFDNGSSLGSTKLANGISPALGMSFEAIGTFVLASSALVASTRMENNPRNQAVLVGTTLFVLIIFIGPLTGASFNPARSLGPSLASGYAQNIYVYIAGPILGALAAGLLFRVIRDDRRNKRNLVCLC